MNIKEYMQEHILILDGGMGSMLQARGLKPGEYPEAWNLTHPEEITDVHRAYYDAGANVVATNTFGATTLRFSEEELERVVCAAVENARRAMRASVSQKEKFIALDIGPTGRLLAPYGDLAFEDAVSVFSTTVRLGVKYGVDLILIETMSDCYEAKAALLAAKECCDLPVFLTAAFGEDGKLLTGATPAVLTAMAEGMGVDAIGANCSLGPRQLIRVAEEFVLKASVPVIIKPNAGLPRVENGKTVYDINEEEFAEALRDMIGLGVRVVGGCCGTTPKHIQSLSEAAKPLSPLPIVPKETTLVASYTHTVVFDDEPLLIGERINPTGKKRFKEALRAHDMGYILEEGLCQCEKGVDILDVNVGLPEIDECRLLAEAVTQLQAVIDLPLQIDTADPVAMERALRCYNGKAMINSVNGKEESMRAVFPLVKKYGGVVVALTLDEDGIPMSADGRFAIAEKILRTAESYGISKKDIVFDTLAMAVSADPASARITLESLCRVKRELGCHTSLGVSNISFGLPVRDAINTTFFASALERGLSAAIMNPYSDGMMTTYYAYRALNGKDTNFEGYITFASSLPATPAAVQGASAPVAQIPATDGKSELYRAIVKGLKEKAAIFAKQALDKLEPMTLVTEEIIPALDEIGRGFEAKTVYLPQLLMSAEAAQSAFEEVKKRMIEGRSAAESGACIVLATVKGDIHDIGKNIVRLLLENYGYHVIDLGRDVAPERVLEEVLKEHAPLVGLSALMTTTVPAMEETIHLLHERAPFCRVMVGGAVLTEEYASVIGADGYAKDAIGAVRLADTLLKK